MRSFPITIAAVLATTILLAPYIPLQVSANPISISSAGSGSFFCFSSNVSMPEASVNLSIICKDRVRTDNYGFIFKYEIDMQSSFVVQSVDNQNTTIAFAYPGSWGGYGNPEYINELEFEVFVDGIYVPTLVVDFSGTGFDPGELDRDDWNEWAYLMEHNFVLFNVSLHEMTAVTIEVNAELSMSVPTDEFLFTYCVGTARAWNGDTIEVVRITLQNTSFYLDTSFNPEESLTETEDLDTKIGTWSLDFNSFTADSVGVAISQKRWPYTPIQNPEDYSLLLVVAGIAVAGVIAVPIVWRIKYAGS